MTTKQRRRPGKTSGQEDRQEGGAGGGRGNDGAGTSPAGALAHGPCCHTKGGSIRVGLKDGGRGRGIFFSPSLHWSRCPYMGKPLSSWGAVLLYALVCGMTSQPINKNGGLAGRVGRCTYMVKPPGVFPERLSSCWGRGAGAPIW